MGVSGGAVFPPAQGAIADGHGTRVSMWIAFVPFLYVSGFAAWCCMLKGRKFTRAAELRVEAERLSHGQANIVRPSEVNEEKMGEKKGELAHVEY